MKSIVNLQMKLVPDVLDMMEERYAILKSVKQLQPIGRRALAESIQQTERHVRSEVDFLQHQGLIEITSKGMYTTNEGELALDELAGFMGELRGIHVLETQLMEKLKIDQVSIVAGNSDELEWVKQEMGKVCVRHLKSIIKKNNTIAVTGGSSLAAVADVMEPLNKEKDYHFVPARGAIGEKIDNQATRIAEKMAKLSNGNFSLLYVPDPLNETTYHSLMEEPSIIDIVNRIKEADIVIHGVGDAFKMAGRRKTSAETMKLLTDNNAVSEAFGYYFGENGQVVHKVRTVGLHIEDLSVDKHVITIAGGISKAKAITSYFKEGKSNLLITDEACAKAILEG